MEPLTAFELLLNRLAPTKLGSKLRLFGLNAARFKAEMDRDPALQKAMIEWLNDLKQQGL